MSEGQHYSKFDWPVFGVDDVQDPKTVVALNGVTADASNWPGPGLSVQDQLNHRYIPRVEDCLGVGQGPAGPLEATTIKIG